MVSGLRRFKDHFREFQDAYVIIGGTACDQLFAEQSTPFRMTKDLDIVLMVDTPSAPFFRHFWEFIKSGGYQHRQRSGKRQHYRFQKPLHREYPAMLELFSGRLEQFELGVDKKITPIPATEDLSSLSAILMDGVYFDLIKQTRTVVNDLSLVQVDGLIPLKAKAWLDLTERRRAGENIKERDIKKHCNDVFALASMLAETPFLLDNAIRADLQTFLNSFPADSPRWLDILASIQETSRVKIDMQDTLRVLTQHFNLAWPPNPTKGIS